LKIGPRGCIFFRGGRQVFPHPPALSRCLATDQADFDPPSAPLEHQEEEHLLHASFLSETADGPLIRRFQFARGRCFGVTFSHQCVVAPVTVRPLFPAGVPLRLCPGADLCHMMGR
jgi:hypothetical protein